MKEAIVAAAAVVIVVVVVVVAVVSLLEKKEVVVVIEIVVSSLGQLILPHSQNSVRQAQEKSVAMNTASQSPNHQTYMLRYKLEATKYDL